MKVDLLRHQIGINLKCNECGIVSKHNVCLGCAHKQHEECHGPECCCECSCKGKRRNPSERSET
jgi:hypothetical protein